MPLISDDSITINSIPMTDYASTAAPATPASGKSRIFTRADGLYYIDDAGAETGPMAAGFSNPMTTAGDTIYGGASGTPTRLAAGTALQVLRMNSGATAPEWAAEGAIDYQVNIASQFPYASSTTPTVALDTTHIYAMIAYVSALNAYMEYAVTLAAGTWKLSWYTMTQNTAAIFTVTLDGVSLGTVDGYAAGTTKNVLKSITGISVATAGRKLLRFTAASKNASSGGYDLLFEGAISMIRTGA